VRIEIKTAVVSGILLLVRDAKRGWLGESSAVLQSGSVLDDLADGSADHQPVPEQLTETTYGD
jgi:hypothetical protein